MEDHFYSSRWNPIRHGRYPQVPIQRRSPKPKLVNIPVHFVGSDAAARRQSSASATFAAVPERDLRVAAATAIQRVVRGFFVRKNVRVVRQVSVEVDAIERKVSEENVKVRWDARERLRVSEELMALLLRLDSVRGVRDFRKKVIGRVIRLQELIDSISDAPDTLTISTTEIANPECLMDGEPEEQSVVQDQSLDLLQETKKGETELGMETLAAATSPEEEAVLIIETDGLMSKEGVIEDQENSLDTAMERDQYESVDPEEEKSSSDNIVVRNQSMDLDVEMNKIETGLEKEIRVGVESPKRKSDMAGIEDGEDGRRRPTEEISMDDEERPVESVEERALRGIMEKMALENENLKSMVAQLCETSAEQCRIMQGLANRVNQLERLTHRKDRRKKRRSGACSALSS